MTQPSMRWALYFSTVLALVGAPSLLRAIEMGEPAERPPAVAGGEAPNPKLAVKQQNGISYVSGGVGDEEQDALERAKNFNLELTMASTSGKYEGVTDLKIENAQGKPVLQVQSDGPIFLAQLPAGEYVVHATTQGVGTTATHKVSVPSSGRASATLTFPAAASGE